MKQSCRQMQKKLTSRIFVYTSLRIEHSTTCDSGIHMNCINVDHIHLMKSNVDIM